MAVNKSKVGDEAVKYRTNNHEFVTEISKQVDDPEGESLGIHKIINKDNSYTNEFLFDVFTKYELYKNETKFVF